MIQGYKTLSAPVAPPRGERGLKLSPNVIFITSNPVAPPRGERGLKQLAGQVGKAARYVAPPRGERGLKHFLAASATVATASLPLVGSVD